MWIVLLMGIGVLSTVAAFLAGLWHHYAEIAAAWAKDAERFREDVPRFATFDSEPFDTEAVKAIAARQQKEIDHYLLCQGRAVYYIMLIPPWFRSFYLKRHSVLQRLPLAE